MGGLGTKVFHELVLNAWAGAYHCGLPRSKSSTYPSFRTIDSLPSPPPVIPPCVARWTPAFARSMRVANVAPTGTHVIGP